jgi:hypothetical protein
VTLSRSNFVAIVHRLAAMALHLRSVRALLALRLCSAIDAMLSQLYSLKNIRLHFCLPPLHPAGTSRPCFCFAIADTLTLVDSFFY